MKKFHKIWSVGLVVVLLVSMLAFAAPASAATLEWSAVKGPGGNGQIRAGSDASFVTVASDGTLFVVDTEAATDVVYYSTNGGVSWDASNAISDDIVALAVSPDFANDSTVFALYKGVAGTAGGRIYISTNGGAKFNPLGAALPTADNETATSIAVSPTYSGGNGEIMVGTYDPDASDYGDAYIWGMKGAQYWQAMGLDQDVTSVAFSPSFPIDASYLAVGSDATDTALHIKVSPDGTWNNPGYTGYPVSIGTVTDAEITATDIAFASDWNGTTTTQQRCFIAVISTEATDTIWRLTGTNLKDVGPGAADDDVYASLAYSGDYTTGTLFAGASGASEVRRTSNPTTGGGVDWFASVNAPTGSTNTYLALDPDFASNNTLWAGTTGTESAVSKSLDGGVNFMQPGHIDTAVNSITDLGAASTTEWFIATENGTGAGGSDSLWRTTNGKDWMRILQAGFDNAPRVVLSPGYATDQTVYFYEAGDTNIRLSTNGGASFSNRIAPGAIADLMPIDQYTLYCGVGTTVRKSGNSGWTWGGPTTITGVGAVISMAYDAGTGDILVGGNNGGVYRSTDDIKTFKAIGGATGIGATADVVVAFDANYGETPIIYAGDNTGAVPGIFRFEIDSDTSWGNALNATATDMTLGTNRIVVASDGTVYAVDMNADGGVQRSINPTAPPPDVEFKAVTEKLGTGYTLQDLALVEGSNMLVAIESTGTQVSIFTDTLTTTAPALVAPDDGATSTETGAVTLSWSAVEGAKTWEYETSTTPNFATGTSTSVAGLHSSITSARVTNLQEGKTYYWRVRVDSKVLGPWSEVRSVTTQIVTASNAPAITSPARGGTGPGGYDAPLQPIFQWGSLKWATGYEFILAKDAGLTDIVVKKTGADALGNVTVYQPFAVLDYNTTYYWQVRALGASTQSDWSPIVGFTTMAEPVEEAPPVVIEQVPPPEIVIETPAPPPDIVIPPAPEQPAPIAPAYIWAVIIIGAILVIAVVVLIVRTRRAGP